MRKPRTIKKTVGKHVKTSAKFGFHVWNLDAMQVDQKAYQKFIEEIIREGVEIATSEYDCSAYFPVEHSDLSIAARGGDKAIHDPTIIYVELPVGPDDIEMPKWSFSLTELVNNMLEMVEHGDGGPIDRQDTAPLIAVRDALRMLADRIDARLPT